MRICTTMMAHGIALLLVVAATLCCGSVAFALDEDTSDNHPKNACPSPQERSLTCPATWNGRTGCWVYHDGSHIYTECFGENSGCIRTWCHIHRNRLNSARQHIAVCDDQGQPCGGTKCARGFWPIHVGCSFSPGSLTGAAARAKQCRVKITSCSCACTKMYCSCKGKNCFASTCKHKKSVNGHYIRDNCSCP
jgi:hypothetical protein